MDQKMRLLRGESHRFSVTIGAGALSAGDPFILTNGLAVAVGDGLECQGVLVDDGAIDETKVRAEMILPGQVWMVTVTAGLTSVDGTRYANAGSGLFDEGTSTNPSIGYVIEGTVAVTDTEVKLFIKHSTIA